ncbi:unnamed protein product [Echinostoma caproni]|uniref:CPSF_A domain-containing protein n=1 Tax=Echinostoma caproni TaxID=27848 RepID=A0A183AR17_9TREM|nr:unnamed protein product [Echinostoma caproni]
MQPDAYPERMSATHCVRPVVCPFGVRHASSVFKFGPDLNPTPLLVLGEAFVPGTDTKHFCKPTHVVVQRDVNLMIFFAFCKNRTLRQFIRFALIFLNNSGKPGYNYFDFNLPHQMALSEELNLLCVADRENHRVLCYNVRPSRPQDDELTYLFHASFDKFSSVYGVAIAPRGKSYFNVSTCFDLLTVAILPCHSCTTLLFNME